MKLKLAVVVVVLPVLFLAGCESKYLQGALPAEATPVSETSIATISLADFRKELEKMPADAKATRLADQLTRFDAVRIDESQRVEASQLIEQLAKRLRSAVQGEMKALHAEALKAKDYAAGSKMAREAGAIIALFPLSEDQKSMEEAESLAQAQGIVMTQLRVIQRKRYNQWAITELQKAQHLIDSSPYPTTDLLDRDGKKERWKDAQNKGTSIIKMIEPSFLEPAVAPFYQELLSQLGGKEKGYRNELLKQVVDPHTPRKILDNF
jgi:hypothetical protein